MQQPAKKRVPLGHPIKWTDEDLDALASISPTDLKAAEALWQRDAPKKYKPLLQASVVEKQSGESS